MSKKYLLAGILAITILELALATTAVAQPPKWPAKSV
jgi:hypothetical protein